MLAKLRALLRNSRGATAVEYGLIISLIVLSMLVALRNVATVTVTMWNNVSSAVKSAN